MADEPELRSALGTDLPAITAIYAFYVANSCCSFELESPDVGEMEIRWRNVQSAGLPYLVLVWDGVIAGFAYAVPYRPRLAYRFTVENSVYIHPDFIGRGFGRSLMQRLITDCANLGYRQMIAVIGDSGNLASVALHRNLGFREVGVLRNVGFKFGRWVDTVLMQCDLCAKFTQEVQSL